MQKRMRNLVGALFVGGVMFVAGSASALSLMVGESSSSPDLTFTVSFDVPGTPLSGYELFFTWDTTQLTFSSATNLYNDLFIVPTFTVLNTGLGSGTTGIGRASVLQLSDFPATDLMELVFTETNPGQTSTNALILSLSAAGLTGGFSPASVVVTNPNVFFTFIPEPSTLVLVGLGSLALAMRRR